MAKLASFRNAFQQKQVSSKGTTTIACKACKKPLWEVKINGTYGTRVVADKKPYPGVGRYEDYWTNSGQPKDLRCPFCNEHYFTAVEGQNGKKVCVPFLPDLRE